MIHELLVLLEELTMDHVPPNAIFQAGATCQMGTGDVSVDGDEMDSANVDELLEAVKNFAIPMATPVSDLLILAIPIAMAVLQLRRD